MTGDDVSCGVMRRLAVLALLCAPAPAAGHEFVFTDVRLEVRANGTWVADVSCDVDASLAIAAIGLSWTVRRVAGL